MVSLFSKIKNGNPADTSAFKKWHSVWKGVGLEKEKAGIKRLILCIICVMVGWQVQAQSSLDVTIGDIHYRAYPNGTATASAASKSISGAITIPSTVVAKHTYGEWNCTVTEVGSFSGCTGITSITIPGSVTTIRYSAFEDCTGLTSVTIPGSVTNIGGYAFSDCTGLTSITISEGVTEIGEDAFKGCTGSIASVTIPGSVTKIGVAAFHSCTGLKSVTISNGVKEIGSYAFIYCSDLISATIPGSVNRIGGYAFDACTSLVSITIPGSVTKIECYTFTNCTGLKSVTISDGVTEIENYDAFRGCTALTSITIPGSVTKIGQGAFGSCTGLTSVTISEGVTSIGGAFSSCTGLKSVTIPRSVTELDGAFGGCTGLASVMIFGSVIGRNTFWGCTGLTSVTIFGNVSVIEHWAFRECTGLTSITIPNSVTSIEEQAFGSCTGLTSVTFPNSVTTIGYSAFENCTGLTSVTIPSSVTTIEDGVFQGCDQLKDFTVNWATPLSVDRSVFFRVPVSTCTLHVPTGKEALYQAAPVWENFYFPNSASLEIAPSTLDFTASGETKSVTVTSNVSWTVSKDATWITVSPALGSNNGTISVTAAANTATSQRTATVTVTGGSITQTVSITQAAYVPPASTLTVSTATLDFAASGETKSVTVTSNVSWTVGKDATWITVSPALGSNNGTISVTAAANTATSQRTGNLTVSGGSITKIVSITQAAYVPPANTLTVSAATLDFAASGETKPVTVTSNVSWTVSKDAAWITVSPALGSNNGTISVTAAANTATSQRTGTVTVTGGSITHTVSITQAAAGTTPPPAPTLTVSPGTVDFAAGGGSQRMTIQSNTDWTAVSSDAWAGVSPASGSGNGTVSMTAAANTGSSARTATVTVSGGGLTRTVTVTQAAAQQAVVAEPSEPEGDRGTINIRLQLPVNGRFTVEFIIRLPAGFLLDRESTTLVRELLTGYDLLIVPEGANSWRLTIRPKLVLFAADETEYRQLVQIAYTMDESVVKGEYEVKLNDVNLVLDGGQVIHQDEITAPVRVTSSVGNAAIDAEDVRYACGVLTVNTPAAERITVYSLSGAVMYQARKTAGEATFDLNSLPKGVLIVRGDSGWAKKIVR
jgi:hypothetical protein